ncbi:hypothetical protein [Raoultella ornithinolytica]|uniref:hypothetical protein n=1 Tax=Raoultella ornithinolytica TaxID=54291 RepID=UPI003A4DF3E9
MNPTDFIRRHITASLMSEGFSESVAGGGLSTAWIITAEAHRQAGRGRSSMIVSFVRVSGLSGKQPRRNGNQQRKSREEVVALNPACSDFTMQIKSTWRGKFMKNHTRVSDYKSSAGKATGDISLRAFK